MKPKTPSPFWATKQDWDVLHQSLPNDYDGHTHFARLLPAERLAWLESAVQFITEVNSELIVGRSGHKADSKKVNG